MAKLITRSLRNRADQVRSLLLRCHLLLVLDCLPALQPLGGLKVPLRRKMARIPQSEV